jgi:hypothetical protein
MKEGRLLIGVMGYHCGFWKEVDGVITTEMFEISDDFNTKLGLPPELQEKDRGFRASY